MHLRKGNKIFIYFFLLFLLGSINNVDIKNFNLISINQINVSGLDKENNLIILKQIKNLNLENIFFTNINKMKNIFEKNSLIEDYKIIKIYPSTLDVELKRTNFLAQKRDNEKLYLIGSNGKLIENDLTNQELPFIFGKPDVNEILELKSLIDQSKFSFNQIENLFFSIKKMGYKFKNKNIIKLPNNNVEDALNNAFNFLKINQDNKSKILDLRINNQIIQNE